MSTRPNRLARKLTGSGLYPGISARAFKRAWSNTPHTRRGSLRRVWERVVARKAKFSPQALAGYLVLDHQYEEAHRVLEAAALQAQGA